MRPYIRGGAITASGASLIITSHTYGSLERNQYDDKIYYTFGIDSVISDRGTNKIGLLVKGTHPVGENGIVGLGGNEANTFTGDVIVEGTRNKLYLSKKDGVTAVRGNIYVKNHAHLVLVGSDQISDSSTVTLSRKGSAFGFTGLIKDVSEKIHALVVENGQGIVSFGHNPKEPGDASKKTLFIDDLVIKDGASLRIMRWEVGRDHLLVRKDSTHLEDALKKISIDGWAKNQIYLKDYNKDYWSIEAAPEPATYGAILGSLGLGLFIYRKRWAMKKPL